MPVAAPTAEFEHWPAPQRYYGAAAILAGRQAPFEGRDPSFHPSSGPGSRRAWLRIAVNALSRSQEPGAREPGAREPGAREPGAREPGAREPGAREPGAREPGAREPGAREPGAREPGAREPGAREPGAREPGEPPSAGAGPAPPAAYAA